MHRDLENIYTYHAPKNDQPKKYEMIDDLCPDSREKSIANTNLEQTVMWANASIARNE